MRRTRIHGHLVGEPHVPLCGRSVRCHGPTTMNKHADGLASLLPVHASPPGSRSYPPDERRGCPGRMLAWPCRFGVRLALAAVVQRRSPPVRWGRSQLGWRISLKIFAPRGRCGQLCRTAELAVGRATIAVNSTVWSRRTNQCGCVRGTGRVELDRSELLAIHAEQEGAAVGRVSAEARADLRYLLDHYFLSGVSAAVHVLCF